MPRITELRHCLTSHLMFFLSFNAILFHLANGRKPLNFKEGRIHDTGAWAGSIKRTICHAVFFALVFLYIFLLFFPHSPWMCTAPAALICPCYLGKKSRSKQKNLFICLHISLLMEVHEVGLPRNTHTWNTPQMMILIRLCTFMKIGLLWYPAWRWFLLLWFFIFGYIFLSKTQYSILYTRYIYFWSTCKWCSILSSET